MISASEKCLYKNEPISVSLSFFFFFAVFSICVWIHVRLYGWENNVSLCLLLCQRWWKGDGGRCSPLSVLFVHHSSVCHLRLFHPSARPVCLSTSFSQRCIMNVFFFIVYFCESYLRQVNPQPAPLSLSVWIIRCLYENSQLRAQTGPATGFQSRSTRGATLVEYGLCSRCHHE